MTAPEVRQLTKEVTQPQIDAYAAASGDHNPIHVDEAFARATPLGGTIAHGMLVLAFISEMMTAAFGRAWLDSGRLDVRFRAPARATSSSPVPPARSRTAIPSATRWSA
jgi:acyl dehydratase